MSSLHTPLQRALIFFGAGLASLTLPIAYMLVDLVSNDVPYVFWIHSVCLMTTLYIITRRTFGSQVLARALWWQTLLFGVLLVGGGGRIDAMIGAAFAVGCSVALVAAGRSGLSRKEDTDDRFAPLAFRGSLILTLTLALADTQALLLYGGVGLQETNIESMPFLICGSVMAAAVYGLYKLKFWGVALNLVANVTIASLVLADVLYLPSPISWGLVATAVIQMLIPVPLLRSMLQKTKQPVATADEIEDGNIDVHEHEEIPAERVAVETSVSR